MSNEQPNNEIKPSQENEIIKMECTPQDAEIHELVEQTESSQELLNDLVKIAKKRGGEDIEVPEFNIEAEEVFQECQSKIAELGIN